MERLCLYDTVAANTPIFHTWDENVSECGAIVEWYWWESWRTERKFVTVPICPPQTPNQCDVNLVFMVRSRWLTNHLWCSLATQGCCWWCMHYVLSLFTRSDLETNGIVTSETGNSMEEIACTKCCCKGHGRHWISWLKENITQLGRCLSHLVLHVPLVKTCRHIACKQTSLV
jgi:hypothetical protein